MKVDGTGFTPMYLDQSTQVPKTQPDDFQKQIVKVNNQTLSQKVGNTVESKALVSTQSSTAVQKSESSMSAYLNAEEKQMLNMLFPPNGRDFGVRAYQQGQRPAVNPEAVGKSIDVFA